MDCVDSRHDKTLTGSYSVLDTVVYDGVNKDEVISFLKDDFVGMGKSGDVVWFRDACCGNARCVRVGQVLMLHSNGGYSQSS